MSRTTALSRVLGLTLLAGLLSGCPSGFTAIDKAAEGTYIVTHYREGFASVTSHLLLCRAEGTRMTCQSIAHQSGSPEAAEASGTRHSAQR